MALISRVGVDTQAAVPCAVVLLEGARKGEKMCLLRELSSPRGLSLREGPFPPPSGSPAVEPAFTPTWYDPHASVLP